MWGKAKSGLPPGLPDCLKKRRLLNEKELSPEECRDYGEKFLAHGFIEDALEFFLKGNYQPGLEKLKALALESGDAQLLARLGEQDPETWRKVAEQALKYGKKYFARRAFEAGGEREQAEELDQSLRKGDF
jgi:hypothetical protein